jgi:hypothetical protein
MVHLIFWRGGGPTVVLPLVMEDVPSSLMPKQSSCPVIEDIP